MNVHAKPQFDALIVGGGAAGLWLLNSLSRCGLRCRLLEGGRLGSGQTLASQGIIHSGLKYGAGSQRADLRDRLSNMPARWRACLAAEPDRPPQDPDLTSLKPTSDAFYLFSSDRQLDRIRSFVATRLLAADSRSLDPADWPDGLRRLGYRGQVAALDEFTLAIPELLERLAAPVRQRLIAHHLEPHHVRLSDSGVSISLNGSQLRAKHLLLCAGEHNDQLLDGLGIRAIRQIARPLHQVIVRDPELPQLDGHCLTGVTGSEPRLTITSHRAPTGGWDWYLGGLIATAGCDRSTEEQIEFARRELRHCIPTRRWEQVEIRTLRINRAEPDEATRHRYAANGRAFVAQQGPVTVCWPIKLTLLPDLADQVLARLAGPEGAGATPEVEDTTVTDVPITVGPLPWQSA